MQIEGHGIAVELPDGWEGSIDRRPEEAQASASGTSEAAGAGAQVDAEHPITHLANFPLPTNRGDYGSGAVETMSSTDVLVCLLEHGSEDVGTALFASEGIPRLTPAQFSPAAMQRTVEGLSGTQAFFTENGRAFCLYAVLGSHRDRRTLVPVINDLLDTLHIAPA
ncbi:hypothetical protein [Actinospongicola halichondriae]|uniref:hypothetical protein n=1 Tax=Actinospongicola halichondriae TaxID=3236844 RepID=UPI003D3D3A7F